MTTTWSVKLVDLRHRRAINDNALDLQLVVTKLVDNVPATWNPWSSAVSVGARLRACRKSKVSKTKLQTVLGEQQQEEQEEEKEGREE